MNLEHFSAEELQVEIQHLKDVLRCLFHTVVCQRAFNTLSAPLKVSEYDCEFFSLTFTRIDNAEISKEIDEKIDQFVGLLKKEAEAHSKSSTSATEKKIVTQIHLDFFTVKQKAGFWGAKEERSAWEKWTFPLVVSFVQYSAGDTAERLRAKATLEQALQKAVMYIIRSADSRKDHIPTTQLPPEKLCHPFDISFKSGSDKWTNIFSWIQTPSVIHQ